MAAQPTPFNQHFSHDVPMRILVEGGGSLPMPCKLSYDVTDPYAVSATFTSGDNTVTWVFGRELLLSGVKGPAGDGDIKLLPVQRTGRQVLRMELSSPDGRAVLEGPLADVRGFLDATYSLLPEGYEWQYVNLDTALAALLDGEAA